ncbi:hypothetical protein VTK56DRAFT_357 [Thermocarpiscus australiensis]
MSPETSAPRRDEASPPQGDDRPAQRDSAPQGHETTTPRPTKFRFKFKSSRSRSRHDPDDDDAHRHRRHHRHRDRSREGDRKRDRSVEREDGPSSRRRSKRKHRDGTDREPSHRHHHRRRHRHDHHHHHRSPSPLPSPFQDPPLSPETAFRESLFDALADDEGAAYWQAVYGQPIHIYSPTKPTTGGSGGGGGELERMTDEEYAAYVRQKMWERTHAGLLEARARRERERAAAERRREEERRIAREMEGALRRGEERRRKRVWRERWGEYVAKWGEWEKKGGGVEGIPWPVGTESGERGEIQAEAVRAFFVNGLGLEELGEKEFAARLKEERVRWHPDKVQQRLGGQVDEKVMRDVTAIFQVVDALWNDTRKKSA